MRYFDDWMVLFFSTMLCEVRRIFAHFDPASRNNFHRAPVPGFNSLELDYFAKQLSNCKMLAAVSSLRAQVLFAR